MMAELYRIHPTDNAAVALRPLEAGEKLRLDGEEGVAKEAIPPGHKIALRKMKPGEKVVKYGFPIGSATRTIERRSPSLKRVSLYKFLPLIGRKSRSTRAAGKHAGPVSIFVRRVNGVGDL